MLKSILLFTLACFSAAAAPQPAGTVSGKMVVNGKERTLTAVRAAKVMDGGREVVRVVVSDVVVPQAAIFDDLELFGLSTEEKFHGVQFDFGENSVTWMLRTKDCEGSFSRSQSPNPFTLRTAGERVEGEVKEKQASDGAGKLSYEIEFKFSAVLEKKTPEIPLTAADAEAAKRHPAAIAYLELQDAIAKGDRVRIRAMAPPEARAQVDGPDFAPMLKVLQMMQERDVRVLKASTKGDETTLQLEGKSAEGGAKKGEATLKLENGKWIMRNEKWRGN